MGTLALDIGGFLRARDLEALACTSKRMREGLKYGLTVLARERCGLATNAIEDSLQPNETCLDLLRYHDVFDAADCLRKMQNCPDEFRRHVFPLERVREVCVKGKKFVQKDSPEEPTQETLFEETRHVSLRRTQISRLIPGGRKNCKVKTVCFGRNHAAVLMDDGTLYVQGDNAEGQLGIPGAGGRRAFVKDLIRVPGLDVVEASTGFYHTSIVLRSGEVLSAGNNQTGQLGLPWTVQRSASFVPPSDDLPPARGVVCGRASTFVMTTTGDVFAWGNNRFNLLGLGVDAPDVVWAPRHLEFITHKNARVVAISPHEDYAQTTFLASSGKLIYVGLDTRGETLMSYN